MFIMHTSQPIFSRKIIPSICLVSNNNIRDFSDFLTVCSCHAMYAFQSESILYSCLNVKELLARNRRKI